MSINACLMSQDKSSTGRASKVQAGRVRAFPYWNGGPKVKIVLEWRVWACADLEAVFSTILHGRYIGIKVGVSADVYKHR